MIKFCTPNGCKKHFLEFEDVDDAFRLFRSQDTVGPYWAWAVNIELLHGKVTTAEGALVLL